MSSSYSLKNGQAVQTSAGIGDPVTAVMNTIKESQPNLHITNSLIENRIVAHIANLSYLGLRNPNITKTGIQQIATAVIAEAKAETGR
jgi:hypothetical protein